MRDKFSQRKRSIRELHARDLERINAAAYPLNREALDALGLSDLALDLDWLPRAFEE
jgi:hypothetical protein